MTTPAHVLAAVRSIPHPRQETAMTAPELTADVRGLLDQLDEAWAAATPGPWAQNGADPAYVIGQVSEDGEEYLDVADAGARWYGPGRPVWKEAEADAALIVAAVNALPQLTAALRAVADLADEADRRVRGSVPASGAEHLIAEGAHTVRVGDLRAAITAALTG